VAAASTASDTGWIASSTALDGLEHRMDGFEHRMDGFEHRMDGLQGSMRDLREDVIERVDLQTASTKNEMLAALYELGGDLRTEMAAQTRTFVFAMLGMLVTLAALAFGALQIT
jgi:hypothetical protein